MFSDQLDAKARAFWETEMEDLPSSTFPYERTAPIVGENNNTFESLRWSIPLNQPRSDIPLAVTAQVVWALLLSEYEGLDDIFFGSGAFVHTHVPEQGSPESRVSQLPDVLSIVPVRAKMQRQTTTVKEFLDYMTRQNASREAFQSAESSWSDFIQLKRQLVFNSIVAVSESGQRSGAMVVEEHLQSKSSLSQCPLFIVLDAAEERSSELTLSIIYDASVISKTRTETLGECFKHLFYQLSPTTSIESSKMLIDLDFAPEEYKNVLFKRNKAHHLPDAQNSCIDKLLERQLGSTSAATAVAIDSWDGTLTYEALNKLSESLAIRLIDNGIKPNEFVGIYFHKSFWAIASIIAVIRAGGAFVPLSPASPGQWTQFVTKDLGINLVLTSSSLSRKALETLSSSQQMIIVDDGDHLKSSNDIPDHFLDSIDSLRSQPKPESPLYAIHTSGTTGTPKVFTITHQGFASGATARSPIIQRGPRSRVLQFAPYNFDPSIEDILTTIIYGGCICVPSENDIMNDLMGFMRSKKVNFANITPSVARTIIPNQVPDMEILLLSGEAPENLLIDSWKGRVELMNGYGPSECSLKCSINPTLGSDDPTNIGFAVGAAVWVVNPENHERLSPMGALGELLIESPSLARGYINRPEETAARFISPPSWLQNLRANEANEPRVYKTGDLVRCNPDGSITYVRRADSQLKFNGQRFEAKQVEIHIQDKLSSLLRGTVVVVDLLSTKKGIADSNVLVAFVAFSESIDKGEQNHADKLDDCQKLLDAETPNIVRHLKTVLLPFMIPSVFMALLSIPVTNNGKIDRKKIRTLKPPTSSMQTAASVKSPVTEREKDLHRLWQKILGLEPEQFGLDDDFFQLGGTSLSVIKLVSEARRAGFSIQARQAFQHPTLFDMAPYLEPMEGYESFGSDSSGQGNYQDEKQSGYNLANLGVSNTEFEEALLTHEIPLSQVQDAYLCTKLQIWFIENCLTIPESTSFRHIIPVSSTTNLSKLKKAVEKVVKANGSLRTRIVQVAGKFVQVVCKDDFIYETLEAIPEVDSTGATSYSSVLGSPLSRFDVVQNDSSTYLVWTCNHAVWDAWSRRLTLADIDFVYEGGEPPVRPQFGSFARCIYNSKMEDTAAALEREKIVAQSFKKMDLGRNTWPSSTSSIERTIKLPSSAFPGVGLTPENLLVSVWTLVAAFVDNLDQSFSSILLPGRDLALDGVDHIMGPTFSMVPLPIQLSDSTIRDHARHVQDRLFQLAPLQYCVDFGEDMDSRMDAAYRVSVHPGEYYEEQPTEFLRLAREKMIPVRKTPYFHKFDIMMIIQKENKGIDFLVCFDSTIIPESKVTRQLDCFQYILDEIFLRNGLEVPLPKIRESWKASLEEQ